MNPCPLYLHYFDRELRTSVRFTADFQDVRKFTDTLLCATTAPLYCAYSGAWESLDPGISRYLVPLIRSGHIGLVSRHPTQAEFLSSRKAMYAHDAGRYPMYFGGDPGERVHLKPTIIKETSATGSLIQELATWAGGNNHEVFFGVEQEEVLVNQVRATMLDTLAHRDHEAVTFSLFSPHLDARSEDPLAAGIVRRLISSAYSKHFGEFGGADIPTGIEGLGYYDRLAQSFPMHDLPILWNIFERLGFRDTAESPEALHPVVVVRNSEEHAFFVRNLRRLLGGVLGASRMRLPIRGLPAARWSLQLELNRTLERAEVPLAGWNSASLLDAVARINRAINGRSGDTLFGAGVEGMEEAMTGPTERLLLVVATEVEVRALLKAAGVIGNEVPRTFSGNLTFHELGVVGGCRLRAVWTQMGSSGVGGSLQTVEEAITSWQPTAIVMVGIAFGLREGSQALGDVLVSRQLTPYGHQRVTERSPGVVERTPRGPARFPASRRLLDRFLSGQLDWGKGSVHFGIVLSGENLVDSPTFKSELLASEPEAIGGEMEGAGLLVAAVDKKVDWIIVKGIADWGENKGDAAQEMAAESAAGFVMHVIQQGGLAHGALVVGR